MYGHRLRACPTTCRLLRLLCCAQWLLRGVAPTPAPTTPCQDKLGTSLCETHAAAGLCDTVYCDATNGLYGYCDLTCGTLYNCGDCMPTQSPTPKPTPICHDKYPTSFCESMADVGACEDQYCVPTDSLYGSCDVTCLATAGCGRCAPTTTPTPAPTASPSVTPTPSPSIRPTSAPTPSPSAPPTQTPSQIPSPSPAPLPTAAPSELEYPPAYCTDYWDAYLVKWGQTDDLIGCSLYVNNTEVCDALYCETCMSAYYCDQTCGVGRCAPTPVPFPAPTLLPTPAPSLSQMPSHFPTSAPSLLPTFPPTGLPSQRPTSSPSSAPSASPTLLPSPFPTHRPTPAPSFFPSLVPSPFPTHQPTPTPSSFPSLTPTTSPTPQPSELPSTLPSSAPTWSPTAHPSVLPTPTPTTSLPTAFPTNTPTISPSSSPSPVPPTAAPSYIPTPSPTPLPSPFPTYPPSAVPTAVPTPVPSPDCSPDYVYRLAMYDTTGDGWQGASWKIYNSTGSPATTGEGSLLVSGSLSDGFSGFSWICLSNGCYEIVCGGGAADSEIGFEFIDAEGGHFQDLSAPYSDHFCVTDGGWLFTFFSFVLA